MKKVFVFLVILVVVCIGLVFYFKPPYDVVAVEQLFIDNRYDAIYEKSDLSYRLAYTKATHEDLMVSVLNQIERTEVKKLNGEWKVILYQTGSYPVVEVAFKHVGRKHYFNEMVLYDSDQNDLLLSEIQSVSDSKQGVAKVVEAMCLRDYALVESFDDAVKPTEDNFRYFLETNMYGIYGFNSEVVYDDAIVRVNSDHYERSASIMMDNQCVATVKILYTFENGNVVQGIKVENVVTVKNILCDAHKQALLPEAYRSEKNRLITYVNKDRVYAKVVVNRVEKNMREMLVFDSEVLPNGEIIPLGQLSFKVPLNEPTVHKLTTAHLEDRIMSAEGVIWYKTLFDEETGLTFDHFYIRNEKDEKNQPTRILIQVVNHENKIVFETEQELLYMNYTLI